MYLQCMDHKVVVIFGMFPIKLMWLIRMVIIFRVMIGHDGWDIIALETIWGIIFSALIDGSRIIWSVWPNFIFRFFSWIDASWVAPMPIRWWILRIDLDTINLYYIAIGIKPVTVIIELFIFLFILILIVIGFDCYSSVIDNYFIFLFVIVSWFVFIPPPLNDWRILKLIHDIRADMFTFNKIRDCKSFMTGWEITFCFNELERCEKTN